MYSIYQLNHCSTIIFAIILSLFISLSTTQVVDKAYNDLITTTAIENNTEGADVDQGYNRLSSTVEQQQPQPVMRKYGTCGYPGSPRNGRVLHLLERYDEGMIVTYECEQNYILLGPMTRTCLANNTWSGRIPICDQSIRNLGLTSASEALINYPPQLAVDGNFRTCFFSNRRKPRWWRVELPKQSLNNQSIISIALTLPPINVELYFSIYVIQTETMTVGENANDKMITNENMTTTNINKNQPTTSYKYNKCASFRGVFSSKTIFVQCTSNGNGLRGDYLQIEDDYPQLEYFGLCEVDIFVQRDEYDCGQIEIPAYGYVLDQQISIDGIRSVEYHCHEGYRLIGSAKRYCERRTGQWSGQEPYCERITCSEPKSIKNGFHRIYGNDHHNENQNIVGSRVVYECLPGFIFSDPSINDTQICNHEGQWSGNQINLPECEPIDCGHPESLLINSEDFFLSGAQFRLTNGSTKFSSIVELICSSSSDNQSSNLSLRCREDGLWTEMFDSNDSTATANCIRQRHNGYLYFYGTSLTSTSATLKNFFRNKNFYIRETSVNIIHLLAAVVIAAFLSIMMIIILMFKRNIIQWSIFEMFHARSTRISNQEQQTSMLTSMKCRLKSTGESMIKCSMPFARMIRNFFHNHSENEQNQQSDIENQTEPMQNDRSSTSSSSIMDQDMEKSRNSTSIKSLPSVLPLKTPSIFTVTASSIDRNNDSTHQQTTPRLSDSESAKSSLANQVGESSPSINKKEDLNQALATFYEEITNAAKQMFSEETDRKLIRAARIAAELDAIKLQQQQQKYNKQQYQWIYSTPPRVSSDQSNCQYHNYFQHHSSGCTSLPPSLHEYHQILPTTPNSIINQQQQEQQLLQQQIYAKVDLIRKHRYRKEKQQINDDGDNNIVNIYQVPKTKCPLIQMSNSNYHYLNQIHQQQQHQPPQMNLLRKAISTPDTLKLMADNNNVTDNDLDEYGEYGIISRGMNQQIHTLKPMKNVKTLSSAVANNVTIYEPVNKYPLKTLL